jgi:hypothetical protein
MGSVADIAAAPDTLPRLAFARSRRIPCRLAADFALPRAFMLARDEVFEQGDLVGQKHFADMAALGAAQLRKRA